MTDVAATNRQMIALWNEKRFSEAAELARALPAGELIRGPYCDLWWHICEELGDAVRDRDAALATRLYELALDSYVKQGTMATGSGEGLASAAHRDRVNGKLQSLKQAG